MKRKSMIANIALNLGLMILSLGILLGLLEFVVFRFILKASDFPRVETVNGVIRYVPDQEGIHRLKNEARAQYTINTDGWNSVHRRYEKQRRQGDQRVAIIGDSYVEALLVDVDKSLAGRLEYLLGERKGSNNCEVYRFGIGGAPMSQYLHVLRREAISYRPDLVIVILTHNDFNESYEFTAGAYSSFFLKLKLKDGAVASEIAPEPYRRRWFTPIRYSATWRYFRIRQRVSTRFIKRLVGGPAPGAYRANIDLNRVAAGESANRAVTAYVFKQLKLICDRNNAKLLIAIDGDRGLIYGAAGPSFDYQRGPLALNRIAAEAATAHGIGFVDLHPVFAQTHRERGWKFDFENDGHWNERGHDVAAGAIYKFMIENWPQLF